MWRPELTHQSGSLCTAGPHGDGHTTSETQRSRPPRGVRWAGERERESSGGEPDSLIIGESGVLLAGGSEQRSCTILQAVV